MVEEVSKRVKTKEILLVVEDKVKVKLSREGYNPAFGARPLRRLITKYVEDLISENMLRTKVAKRTRSFRILLNELDEVILKEE